MDSSHIMRRAATAAGGLGILAVSALPAMYRLGLLSDPSKDIGKLIGLIATAAFFGVFFVIPLRKYYIVHQKLTFPTPAATVSVRALMVSAWLILGRYRHIPFALSIGVNREQPLRKRSHLRYYIQSSSFLFSKS
jgi:uncharacterized oligopeptide transporter (OPT) family protein